MEFPSTRCFNPFSAHHVGSCRTGKLRYESAPEAVPLPSRTPTTTYRGFCSRSSLPGGNGCWTCRVGRAGTFENGSTVTGCSTCVHTHTQRSRYVKLIFSRAVLCLQL